MHGSRIYFPSIRLHVATRWICCQLGAREHYGIARALYRQRTLEHLFTDAWNVGQRFHHGLDDASVAAFNLSLTSFELLSWLRGLQGWQRIIARNEWFQHNVVRYLTTNLRQRTKGRIKVFAYSYAARDILRFAKQCGWKTVLGQIDPGPLHERIVSKEVARYPEMAATSKPAPAEYWGSWREECELADYIVVNSQWSGRCLMKAGVDGSKLAVVPLGYEALPSKASFTRSYPMRFSRERPLRVLFLGQVNVGKGVVRLLNAIRAFGEKPVEFWFVGQIQVSIPPELRRHPRIRWFGSVARTETASFYRGADIMVFPTLSDGFGLTQLEAQAFKLPIIVSENCGEVIRDGENGIVLAEVTAGEIGKAIRRVLNDPALLARMSKDSKVEDRFSLDALGNNLRRLVHDLN